MNLEIVVLKQNEKKKSQIDMMKQTDKIDNIKTGRHIYQEETS